MYLVQLQSSTGVGAISVDGVVYPVGTTLMFIQGTSYSILGAPPSGYTFSDWATSGGAVVSTPSNIRTSTFATGVGNVILQFLASSGTVVSCPSFTVGGTTTCTATVTGSSPTGTVTFSTSSGTGSFTTPNPCTLASQTCTITYKDTSAGTPTITATYSGDSNNAGSYGTTKVTVTLIMAPAVGVSCPSFTVGETTTCTAMLMRGNSPTGTVTFTTTSGTGSFTTSNPCTLASQTCTITYKDTAAGTPTITATYSGDSSNGASNGNTIVTVSKAASTTSVSCPSFTAGGITTCTATVTGYNPTNTVTFTTTSGTGSFTTANPCTLSSGSCTITYTDTAAGTPTITATYSGDSNNAGSLGTNTMTVTSAGTVAEFYCVGGESTISSSAISSVYQGTILSSNPSVITWVRTPNYPLDVVDHSCAISGSALYCVGGDNNKGAYTSNVYYAPVSGSSIGSWQQTKSYPDSGLSDSSCVASGGYIYCISGAVENPPDYTPDVYSAAASGGGITGWNRVGSYPVSGGLRSMSCTTSNGYVYCVGGLDASGTQYTNVEVAAVESGGTLSSWSKSSNSLSNNPSPDSQYALAGLECVTATASSGTTYLYCIDGGDTKGCFSNPLVDTAWYAPINGLSVGLWKQATPYPLSLDSLSCIVNNNAIYCTGGGDEACGTYPSTSATYYATINSDGSLGSWNSATPYGGGGLLDLVCDNS